MEQAELAHRLVEMCPVDTGFNPALSASSINATEPHRAESSSSSTGCRPTSYDERQALQLDKQTEIAHLLHDLSDRVKRLEALVTSARSPHRQSHRPTRSSGRLCRHHLRFGASAQKCVSPCSYCLNYRSSDQ